MKAKPIVISDKDFIKNYFNPSIEYLQWNQTDGCIYFNTTDEDCKNIYRYVPSKNIFEKLPLKEDVINSFSLPKDAPVIKVILSGSALARFTNAKGTALASPARVKPLIPTVIPSWINAAACSAFMTLS